MWKKFYLIFLILLFVFYVYFSLSINLYKKNILKEKVINKDKVIGVTNSEYRSEDIVNDTNLNEKNADIIGYITIGKIKLNRKLYDKKSSKNTVKKSIQILEDSDMPDVIGGNFILAAHSGFSSVAYFRDLDKIEIGDDVIIKYSGMNYHYIVEKKYDVPKTGKVQIKRERNRTSITLITCLGDDRQLVVIGYLV